MSDTHVCQKANVASKYAQKVSLARWDDGTDEHGDVVFGQEKDERGDQFLCIKLCTDVSLH